MTGSNKGKRFSFLHHIKKEVVQNEDDKGLTLHQFGILRDKTHKEEIKKTLEEKQYDMKAMIKNYNLSKNIYDLEEIREKMSQAQRKNLVNVIGQSNYKHVILNLKKESFA